MGNQRRRRKKGRQPDAQTHRLYSFHSASTTLGLGTCSAAADAAAVAAAVAVDPPPSVAPSAAAAAAAAASASASSSAAAAAAAAATAALSSPAGPCCCGCRAPKSALIHATFCPMLCARRNNWAPALGRPGLSTSDDGSSEMMMLRSSRVCASPTSRSRLPGHFASSSSSSSSSSLLLVVGLLLGCCCCCCCCCLLGCCCCCWLSWLLPRRSVGWLFRITHARGCARDARQTKNATCKTHLCRRSSCRPAAWRRACAGRRTS